MSVSTPMAYVYFDGAEVYVHPAQVVVADSNALAYAPTCITECGVDFRLGEVILYTDAHEEGHATAHLNCLLATSGALVTLAEAERMQTVKGRREIW